MVYDHDTLRLAAAWTGQGFIDWNGINFNGRHQVHPRIVGDGPGRQPGRPRLGKPRDRELRRTSVSAVGTAGLTAPCRAPGPITRGFIATATR